MIVTTNSKAEIRSSLGTRLAELASGDVLNATHLVRTNLSFLLDGLSTTGGTHDLLSYVSREKWLEIDVSPVVEKLRAFKVDYVPPRACAVLPLKKFDVVLVPLHGFNSDGYRLGHGGGWYDRFLATQPGAYKIGIGLAITHVDFLYESHDIRMDAIVTESLIHRYDANNATP